MKARHAVAFVLILGLGIGLANLGASRRPVSDPQGRPSVLFTDDSGARALYLLLQRTLGADAATTLGGPLSELRPIEGSGPDTLLVAGPIKPLEHDELFLLDQWLESGGQLILASPDGWTDSESSDSLLESHGVQGKPRSGSPRIVALKPGPASLYLEGGVEWEGEFEVLAQGEDEVMAISVPVGKGRIVALADSSLVSNKALAKADNGVWLYHLVADWGDGRAVFDEHHLGLSQSRGLGHSISRFLFSSWGLPFLQALLVGLVYLVIQGRRLGRPVVQRPAPVLEPLLLVHARAGLLEASSARSLAISRYGSELSYQLRSPGGQPRDLTTLEGEAGKEFLQIQQRAERGQANNRDLLRSAQLAWKIREDVLRGDEQRNK